jgi:hypothetical protein
MPASPVHSQLHEDLTSAAEGIAAGELALEVHADLARGRRFSQHDRLTHGL